MSKPTRPYQNHKKGDKFMSGTIDASRAGERISMVMKKHRAALAPEERRLMALQKIAEQDVFVAKQHAAVVEAGIARLKQLRAAADKSNQELEAAKAALEGESK
jgi:hypothetical protein